MQAKKIEMVVVLSHFKISASNFFFVMMKPISSCQHLKGPFFFNLFIREKSRGGEGG